MFGTSPPLHPSALHAIGGRGYDAMATAYQQPMPQVQPTAYGGVGFGLSGMGSMGFQQGMMAGGGGAAGEQAFPSVRGMGGMGTMSGIGVNPGMAMGMGMPGMGMGMGGMSGFGNGLVLPHLVTSRLPSLTFVLAMTRNPHSYSTLLYSLA
ncbi:hypothetical protein I317_07265 [Kwoniella heveanensis CBS 569]|uniref:Uncharacterized protein n=1 Tax=Kwoniella heveanensis BCC8398 TaxID=1296120 RepID=A0A1B9GXX0_9TREE|nr:hypothetical protein I316_02374 [Kwoniella heveanensis BCC8398]OCF38928.1 hypothetical protein I317_07265 [Kwoniella heveanensis CBS 569]